MKHKVSAPNEYKILRRYEMSTKYGESVVCRMQELHEEWHSTMTGIRHSEIHTFMTFTEK